MTYYALVKFRAKDTATLQQVSNYLFESLEPLTVDNVAVIKGNSPTANKLQDIVMDIVPDDTMFKE